MSVQSRMTTISATRSANPLKDINVILLGQTGVGKSTFINALVNYICDDTLEEATRNSLEAPIPSRFTFFDDDTMERTIQIGKEDEFEDFSEIGRSNTQQCRSFVFPIGNRNLRIIDAPGIGDTRGLEYDMKNFQEVLNYISQYEHLNGICVLLKPNEERLTVGFKFCFNELMRHLDRSAADNIVFVFTNVRSTLYRAGTTSTILRKLLEDHETNMDVQIPFTRHNTFLFDNEGFRYLAILKNGFHLNTENALSYGKSWDHSRKEYTKLMTYVVKLPPHLVKNTISVNEAEQLIRKLARPIAEVARLIEQNLQLAEGYKEDVQRNRRPSMRGLPQKRAKPSSFQCPRTVCTSEKCARRTVVNEETKIEYTTVCHDPCYLKGVIQETLNDPRMLECSAINFETGKCLACGCSYKEHVHPTYEIATNLTRMGDVSSTGDIQQRINDLEREKAVIEDAYQKLAKFLYVNSLLPVNDAVIEYFEHFIKEERMKQHAGNKSEIMERLIEMKDRLEKEAQLLRQIARNEPDRTNVKDVLKPEDIIPLIETLYRLPINGSLIREQVEGIQTNEEKASKAREVYPELPARATRTTLMRELKALIPS